MREGDGGDDDDEGFRSRKRNVRPYIYNRTGIKRGASHRIFST